MRLRGLLSDSVENRFPRAPFDLIDRSGRFIEVKVARYRHHHTAHQWRVAFTGSEIRFMSLMELLVYVEWGDNASLIPATIWRDRIVRRKLQKSFTSNDKWSLVFDIPLDHLNRFLIFGIPTDVRRRMWEAENSLGERPPAEPASAPNP